MNLKHLSAVFLGGKRFCSYTVVPALLAALTLTASLRAQSSDSKGTLEGTVQNLASGLPLGRAKVIVRETAQEVLTDDSGRYVFRGVPAGTLQVDVSYLGFEPQSRAVSVSANQTVSHDFRLSRQGSTQTPGTDGAPIVLAAFEVVADQTMSAQALAMNVQRHASNIKNVVAFDELGDRGFENIGNYVRFLPGVAIIEDGENPGKIAMGGFPAEMSSLQLDGADLAGTGIGPESSRTMALQEVPMMNIERVEVTKVPTPDMSAAGLGGSLNLVTKSLLGIKKPTLSYQAYMNFNNRDGLSFDGGAKQPTPNLSPDYIQPSLNASYAFPVGKRLALSLGVSRSWKQRPTDDTPSEVAFWNLKDTYLTTGLPKDFAFAIGQWKQEADITRTENYQLNVDWKVAQNDILTFGIQHRIIDSEKNTSFFTTRININYDAIGDANFSQSRGNTGRIEMGSNNPLNYESITHNTQASIQYRHRGPLWRIDGQASYSAAERVRSSRDKGYFAGTFVNILNLNIRGEGINAGSSIGPTTYILQDAAGRTINPYDGDNYSLLNTTEEYAVYKTDLASGRVDAARTFGNHFSVKSGLSYNRMEKDDIRPNKAYTFVGNNRVTAVSAYDLIDESIDVKFNGNEIRWVSPVKAYKIFEDHPEWFTLNSSAVQNQATNSKRLLEDISAAYVRFDIKFLQNRLNMAGGLRYEKTTLDGWSMLKDTFGIYVRDANGKLIPEGTGYRRITTDATELLRLQFKERGNHESKDYDGLYPSFNFNYAFTDNLVARAAYARTLGRPDVRYVVAGITLPVPTDTNPTSARTIVVGNPGLEPWTADSLHVSLDSYHLKGGFGSIGAYHKSVKNFFAQRGNPATEALLQEYGIPDDDIPYMLADNYVLRRWENVGKANLVGVETSYRQDLLFVPSWLKLTQVWVNYTHLKVSGENEEDFVGFTPDTLSFGINYIRPRFSVRLTGSYQAETRRSHILVVPGTSGEGFLPQRTYEYQAAATQYGISAEYAFTKRASLYLNWNNVFAEELRIYRRAPDTPKYAQNAQRYVMPSYIMLGVRGRF